MTYLRPALVMLILLTLITGIAYPLLTTGLAQLLFPGAANGSLLFRGDKAVGSALIGQNFTRADYFWGRPSATGDSAYNPLALPAATWRQPTRRWIRLSPSAQHSCARPTLR